MPTGIGRWTSVGYRKLGRFMFRSAVDNDEKTALGVRFFDWLLSADARHQAGSGR
jgi:hypothetical protein